MCYCDRSGDKWQMFPNITFCSFEKWTGCKITSLLFAFCTFDYSFQLPSQLQWVLIAPTNWKCSFSTFSASFNTKPNIFRSIPSNTFQLREGFPVHLFPKYRHCLDGGGSDPCLDFFEGFVHMHWGPSKVIIHHQKVIISPEKCSFSSRKAHSTASI